MPNQRAHQALTHYLTAPPPYYALLIEGGWGAGKSHFWKTYCKEQLAELKRTDISFSVAGLSTLEDLQDALFLASVQNLAPALVRETSSLIWRTALRHMKINPDEIKLRAELRSGVTVVCLDDVERFASDFKVLFGFIKGLLDDETLHVVLIGDDTRAAQDLPNYASYRERAVGRTATIWPQRDALYDVVVAGYGDQRVRRVLEQIRDAALELFDGKRLNNLRTLRSILDELYALLRTMDWPVETSPQVLNLLTALTFHAIATAANPANRELVAQAFEVSDMEMGALLMDERCSPMTDRSERSIDELTPAQLLEKFGFASNIYAWPSSFSFAQYVRGNGADSAGIAADFQLFANESVDISPLVQLDSYRSMEDDAFNACVDAVLRSIRSQEFTSLQDLWTSWATLGHLSSVRLTPWTKEELRDIFLDVIQCYDAERVQSAVLEQLGRHHDADDDRVWVELERLQQRVEAFEQAQLELRWQQFLIEGEGSAPTSFRESPFSHADARQIKDRLTSAGREGVRRMTKFYRRRAQVVGIGYRVRMEVPFATLLANIIDSEIPEGRLSLDQAAWVELAQQLHRFAADHAPRQQDDTEADRAR